MTNPHAGSRPVFERAAYLAAAGELSKALEGRVPIIVATGPPIAGRRILEQLLGTCCGPRTLAIAVNSLPGDIQDFLREVLEGFGLLRKPASEAIRAGTSFDDLVGVLDRFLASLRSLDAVALIVVNDAAHLDPGLLDQMRILSDLNADASHRPLQIVILGSSVLGSVVDRYNAQHVAHPIMCRLQLNTLESPLHAIQLQGEQRGPVVGRVAEFQESDRRIVGSVGHRTYLRRPTGRTVRLGIAAGLFIAVTTIVGWRMRDAVAVAPQEPGSSVGVPASKSVSPVPAERSPSENATSPTYVPMVPVVPADVSRAQNTPSAPMPSAQSGPVRPVVAATITPKNLQNVSVSELLRLSDALSHKPDVRALEQVRTELIRRQSTGDATNRDELRSALAQVESAVDTARQLQLEEDGRRLTAGAR